MDCSNVKKISDVTNQVAYVDDNAGGKNDSPDFVAGSPKAF